MEPTGQSSNIIMMVGLPGSGKSSVIRRLLADFADKEYVVLSQQALAAGKNIIVDRTNRTVGIRATLLRDVPPGYIKTAVICEVEPEELNRRLADGETRTGIEISEKVLTKMIAAYQPPSHPEFDEIKRVRFVAK